MRHLKYSKSILAGLALLFCYVENAHAQSGWQAETLSSLSELHLQIDKENCGSGSSIDQLQRGVTYYLNNSGVPISENSSNSVENTAHIELDITCSRQTGQFTYLITASINQPVTLNGSIIEATTYIAGSLFGRSDSFHFNNNEADFVIEVLSTLISDWHAVH